MNRILLVEDDDALRDILKNTLIKSYEVLSAPNMKVAKEILHAQNIDLVLLDLGLPDGSGLELCSYIKTNSQTKNIPILIVSGRDEIATKVAGFELGADDYIQKPFVSEELFVRVKAKLRSNQARAQERGTNKGCFLIDEQKLKIFVTKESTQEIPLSPTEFKLLSHFIQNEGIVFTRDQLISICNGSGYAVTDRSIDTHIYSLRKKVDKGSGIFTTHYGAGYSFQIKTAQPTNT